MNFILKIAYRYFRTKREFNAINIIVYISMSGIIIGTAALIIVMSIFNGFHELTKIQLTGFDPHLRILPIKGHYFSLNNSDLSKIESLQEVQYVEPVLTGNVILSTKKNLSSVKLQTNNINLLDSYTKKRDFFYLLNKQESTNNLYIGFKIAETMGIKSDDTIEFLSPNSIEMSIRNYRALKPNQSKIKGLLMTNIKNYDAELVLADYNFVRKVLLTPKNVFSQYDILLKNIDYTEIATKKIQDILHYNATIINWEEMNGKLFNIMQFERISTFLILGIIIIIASFNILISITMTVIEKQKDIAILISLGATRRQIKYIFLLEGLIIGIIASIVGTLISAIFFYLHFNYNLFPLDSTKYIIDKLPIEIHYFQIISIIVLSTLMSVLASIYPAKRASNMSLINSLREE